MNKTIMLLFVGISLVACNIVSPQPSDPKDLAPIGFTIVRLHPDDGDLQVLLSNEAQKAIALGQIPVVEFDAPWCPPCRAIDAAIKAQNELILNAYRETYIIRLDVDQWGWDSGKVQDFYFDGIPAYFKLDADGQQTGDVIVGSAWGEDIPENIAPVMEDFFHGQ